MYSLLTMHAFSKFTVIFLYTIKLAVSLVMKTRDIMLILVVVVMVAVVWLGSCGLDRSHYCWACDIPKGM